MLEGKRILITGGSIGLGRAITEACLHAGADIAFCARNIGALEQSAQELSKIAGPQQRVYWKTCDVSDPGQVDALLSEVMEKLGGLDVLINNAGIYGPKGGSEEVDWDEWRKAIEINLFGVMLPCRAAIPHFKQAGRGKIINLSGGGATAPLPFLSAYAASKAAVVRLTETLAGELRPHHIDVNAVAPGALNTRLLDEVMEAGPERVGADYYARALKQKESGGASLSAGADLCVYLASAASDGITGKLISAVWDPWKDLAAHREELAGDIYTLRRIVPEDRGKKW
jgi:3-oxoacyl-[acyl-carrier protein] reductase